MNKRILFLLIGLWYFGSLRSQTTFPSNGAPSRSHNIHAFINATLYSDFETVLKNAVLLVRDGKVLSVGENLSIPKEAIIHDLKGKFIYPSFIDIFSDYGIPEMRQDRRGPGPQMESSVKGAYGWNQAIRSEVESYKVFKHNLPAAEQLKKAGFGILVASGKGQWQERGEANRIRRRAARRDERSTVARQAPRRSQEKLIGLFATYPHPTQRAAAPDRDVPGAPGRAGVRPKQPRPKAES